MCIEMIRRLSWKDGVFMQETVNEHAIKEAKETKGIVALSFHWFSPIGGHDKSFYAKKHRF